jgi:segregation and condensation protein B
MPASTPRRAGPEPAPTPRPEPDERLLASVEAVLLAMDKRLPAARIAEACALGDNGPEQIARSVEALNERYEATGRAFRIEHVAGGYRVMTLPEFAGPVAAVRGMRDSARLSRAAIETLSIVAYRQPITRAEIEAIRGVAAGEVLRTLLDKRLVTIVGRARELGRPMLYGTSKRFLEIFGLRSIKDLPPIDAEPPGPARAEPAADAGSDADESDPPAET